MELIGKRVCFTGAITGDCFGTVVAHNRPEFVDYFKVVWDEGSDVDLKDAKIWKETLYAPSYLSREEIESHLVH